MFDRLGTLIARRWLFLLLFWALVVAVIYRAAPRWDDITHDGLPEGITELWVRFRHIGPHTRPTVTIGNIKLTAKDV